MLYWVAGWKIDPIRGLVNIFEQSKSLDPGPDVEQAIALGSHHIDVCTSVEKDFESFKRDFVQSYAQIGMKDNNGRYLEPPLQDGTTTYSVIGMAPTGKFDPIEKERVLYKPIFKVSISANPRRDVERALRLGCTRISVGVNYEPSEEEQDQEE